MRIAVVRLVTPIVWRVPGHGARKLYGFAKAEQGSRIDLLQAAHRTTSASRRVLYLRHALDETRHAAMFWRRSTDLRLAAGRAPFPPPVADTEQLFARLGELRFLAFVHRGERRGRRQFERYADHFGRRGDTRTRTLFEAILADEHRHERYTRALLVELAGSERATLVGTGHIVAFCQGRFEWGPRALGNRSILADPADPDSRERLNRAIKRREPFRPFAPAVLRDRADEYFDGAAGDLTPFMTTVCPIAPRHRERLAAVRHVDDTARVQTVTDASAPELAAVLRALDRTIGLPIALNTSFNGAGEPIIAGGIDALGFLVSHPIDALVVGDLVITRGAA